MSIALLFWVIMLVWLIFGVFTNWPKAPGQPPWPIGGHIILWVLLALLGWAQFGAAVHK
jgi:hypothetical protein